MSLFSNSYIIFLYIIIIFCFMSIFVTIFCNKKKKEKNKPVEVQLVQSPRKRKSKSVKRFEGKWDINNHLMKRSGSRENSPRRKELEKEYNEAFTKSVLSLYSDDRNSYVTPPGMRNAAYDSVPAYDHVPPSVVNQDQKII